MAIKGNVTYSGLELSAEVDNKEDVKDLIRIAEIMIKHDVKVGSYDSHEESAHLTFDTETSLFSLYLGR